MRVVMLAEAIKRHVIEWANFVVKHDVELHLISDSRPPEGEYDDRIEFHHPHWSLLQNILTFKLRPHMYAANRDKWRVYKPLIEKIEPDLLHAQEAIGYGPIFPHFQGYPKVLTPWGTDIERVGTEPGTLRSQLVVKGAQAATLISTNATGLEEHWSNLLSIPQDRFDCFSWGIRTERFAATDSGKVKELREKWKLPTDKRIIFNSRNPLPNYRPDKVADAWQNLTPGNAVLVLLTGGFELPDCWQNIESDSLKILDQKLTPDEMAELYQLSDYSMNLPTTDLVAQSLLEGMACGCIPINAKNPAYTSVIRESRGEGVWVDADEISLFSEQLRDALAISQDKLDKMQAVNAALMKSDYDEKVCRAKMLDVYERAVAIHQRKYSKS